MKRKRSYLLLLSILLIIIVLLINFNIVQNNNITTKYTSKITNKILKEGNNSQIITISLILTEE